MRWTEQELAEMRCFDSALDEQDAAGELSLTYEEYAQSNELERDAQRGRPAGKKPKTRREYYLENREYALAYQREYYQAHKDRITEKNRRRYQQHHEEILAYRRKWREERRAKKAREAGGEGKGI